MGCLYIFIYYLFTTMIMARMVERCPDVRNVSKERKGCGVSTHQ